MYMTTLSVIKKLVARHKYKLALTYILFTIETAGNLLRFYFFGEAINGLIKGSYQGLLMLACVHCVYLVAGTVRHIYDTRTYSAIYTSLVTRLLSRTFSKADVSKLSAHSMLAREFVDFLEHDLVYVAEAVYNLAGSLVILLFYDKMIVLTCLAIMIPVVIASYFYGKKMRTLTRKNNDELEQQVNIISSGNKKLIHKHYHNLRKWQIKISDKEAWNFGFMELMVLLVILLSLVISKQNFATGLLAGSLFGIYSYILKFAAGLDTIPYTVQRLSVLGDITRRIELYDEGSSTENESIHIPAIENDYKISA